MNFLIIKVINYFLDYTLKHCFDCINKFNKNMQNDIKHYKQLEQMDIKVIVIWECELKECFDYRMESLLEEIKNDE